MSICRRFLKKFRGKTMRLFCSVKLSNPWRWAGFYSKYVGLFLGWYYSFWCFSSMFLLFSIFTALLRYPWSRTIWHSLRVLASSRERECKREKEREAGRRRDIQATNAVVKSMKFRILKIIFVWKKFLGNGDFFYTYTTTQAITVTNAYFVYEAK